MSKEATGQFGTKLGSDAYWSNIHRSTILDRWLNAKTNYRSALQALGARAAAAIEDIYDDLSKLGRQIRYLPSADRNALAKQVKGLYDICMMSNVSCRHSNECIQALNLSVMSPWSGGFRDERGIEKAISFINRSSYSGTTAMDLLREAVHWSTSSAAGRDPKKLQFLETVAQGHDSRFLQDVLDEYQNQNGQHLEEDGVYGKETGTAIDRLINRVPEVLKDPNKLRLLSLATELCAAITVASTLPQELDYAIKKSWQLLWNTIWNLGAECYLRPKGYDVAALLLQHSLKRSPGDLHFSQSHFVTQKIIRSKGFQRAFRELENNILENPDIYTLPGSISVNFQETGDTDLYYGIRKCEFYYTCIRNLSSVRAKFTMSDKYNFDHIRTIGKSVTQSVAFDFGLGNLANDFGLLSQETGVISPYYIYIEFEKTIDPN